MCLGGSMKKSFLLLSLVVNFAVSIYAEHWPTGYYTTVSDPANIYYYNDENRWYCHVQNPTQAALYDVQDQVRVVGDVYSFLSLSTSLNECSWPDGFYTTGGDNPVVYRLYPGNICTITSDEMLAAYGGTDQVIYAEVNSDFGSHRTFIGQCFWPGN